MRVLPRTFPAFLRAREREQQRDLFVGKLLATLEQLVIEGGQLEPFPHGDIIGEIRWTLNGLAAEHGDQLAIQRRARRVNANISGSKRMRIYRRDKFRCQRCGWQRSGDIDLRNRDYRQGLYLTLDHIVPLSKGGGNSTDNLVTVCQPCNQAKGHTLPQTHEVTA